MYKTDKQRQADGRNQTGFGRAVNQAIANLFKEKKTVVMIAHTLSIVKNADQSLVVADGKITESGTHTELLVKNGKYAAMWNAERSRKFLHEGGAQ